MKVAVLHVTRMKVTTEQYNLLTEASNSAVTKHIANQSSETDAIVYRNFFINSGQTWEEVKFILDEINSYPYEGMLLWMTPGASKLSIYSEKIINFVIDNVHVRSKLNLCQRNGFLGPLKKGQATCRYGYPVNA